MYQYLENMNNSFLLLFFVRSTAIVYCNIIYNRYTHNHINNVPKKKDTENNM